jgi:hypothetical protein
VAALVYPVSWCDHSTSEISRQSSRHLQKSKERSQGTAGIRDRALGNAGAEFSHEHIHICQGRQTNGLRFAAQLPEEATRGLHIAHQSAIRNAIVGSAVLAIFFQQR